MSILQNDIDTGLELRFREALRISDFRGASECNESVAVAKFYNLSGCTPRSISKNPVEALQYKMLTLVAGDWAANFNRVEKWVEICRALVRIRYGKMRISIFKRQHSSGNYWEKYSGPTLYVKVERQGMRKRNHWYSTIEFKIQAEDDYLGPYIINGMDCSDAFWTHIYFDENGNPYREF